MSNDDLKTAIKRYREAADAEYVRPDKTRCYCRNNAQHLLDANGNLLAVVYPTGEVSHGRALAAALRQFCMGMPGA